MALIAPVLPSKKEKAASDRIQKECTETLRVLEGSMS